MKDLEDKDVCWSVCETCQGRGKKSRRIRKKIKLQYQKAVALFRQTEMLGLAPVPPKGHLYDCLVCKGSGLVLSGVFPETNIKDYPHVAIIGGGIGGIAVAIGCLHRGIPFTLYERDCDFETRSQGYGLTLQQASKAIDGLGILSLDEGVVSTRHVVHSIDGEVIGEWGIRKWLKAGGEKSNKRTNIHIARQALRSALLKQLGSVGVQWNHKLVDLQQCEVGVEMTFEVGGAMKAAKADLVIGADGIRSSVRKLILSDHVTPLRYLGCIVILGICPLAKLVGLDSPLLDSATVFQTSNGNERIYMMPYDSESIMWQLSFPMSEKEAKALSVQGAHALKEEACLRTLWHDPIPQILKATGEVHVSGYPVYDRELLSSGLLAKVGDVTLIGDAAHPMSPFKGQGANQAILDALALVRGISKGCNSSSNWREVGLRESVLGDFEEEMLERSSSKVKGSAEAADFLHSDIVLHKGDEPRGRCIDRKDV